METASVECNVKWTGGEGMTFLAETGSGHVVAMDGAPASRRRPTDAPGRNRTSDTRFRKPVLYPLSYEGADRRIASGAPPQRSRRGK